MTKHKSEDYKLIFFNPEDYYKRILNGTYNRQKRLY